MTINVKIISKEIVKPSSPAPHKFTNLKLSFLHQIAPPIYVPLILFYQYQHHKSVKLDDINRVNKLSASLKQSLSDILSMFSLQINFFDCGGIAIAICLSHRIADGHSLAMFAKAWAEKCRGNKKFAAMRAVNVRPRIRPSILQNSFGNRVMYPMTFSEGDREFHELINQTRKAISEISDDQIKRVQEGDNYLDDLKKARDVIFRGEVDYGWGKPIWACTTKLPYVNMVILMNTPLGNEIEVWENMMEKYMKIMQRQMLFVNF
ncbi:Vinorine synthase [Handroanthus impetiginosus]|uniref:Vinorine synthase n=1 Tax=Handroanthus impetiginosus TaxID=429701 RepID=A0A2G9H2H7_9LAMI|nr:Vinorine synthase [Handroanthus impetiginosus]